MVVGEDAKILLQQFWLAISPRDRGLCCDWASR